MLDRDCDFLKPTERPPWDGQLERPISERDVYRLWWRAGYIRRAPRSPLVMRVTPVELSGLFVFGVMLGFCLGYYFAR
jgi:hypothetical protein